MSKVRTAYGFPVIVEHDTKTGKANKRPLIKAWQSSTTPIDDLSAKNFGINVPEGVIVIDIDTHKGCSKAQIEQSIGDTLDDSGFLQTTISGGQHYGYEVPPNMTFKQGSNLLGITGFDTRCYGRGWVASGEGYHGDIKTRIQSRLPILPVAFVNALVEEGRLERVERPHTETVNQDELKDALRHIPADDYDEWIKVGMALYGAPGGLTLWDQWSATADNYDPAQMEAKWDSFANTSVSLASVFYLAQQHGWDIPGIMEEYGAEEFEVIEGDEIDHPLARYLEPPDVFKATPFVIEGVLSEGVTLLAAYPSAGKTTALVTMACIAAGLIKEPSLPILHWRRVVYITEHPQQVHMMLKAISDHYFIDQALLFDRIKVVEGLRMPVQKVVQAEKAFIELSVGVFLPWVVMDTQAATIQMENENDNAEASKVMAALKQRMSGLPVTLCAHTSKAHKHGVAEDMTARGASAFEGDAVQVLYLSIDEAGNRFIEVSTPKHRFETDVHSVAIKSYVDEINVVDRLGEFKTERVRWAQMIAVTQMERAAADPENVDASTEILALMNDGEARSRNAICGVIGGRKKKMLALIKAMVESGDLVIRDDEKVILGGSRADF